MTKISVVIPTHNRAHTIVGAVMSVAAQSHFVDFPFEIVIVDDASTDGTAFVVERLQDLLKCINYIRLERNMGANHARNVGVAASSGEVIFFHDSDDFWLPDKVSKQVSFMEETASDASFCRLIRRTTSKVSLYPSTAHLVTGIIGERDFKHFLRNNPVSTQCLAIRREALIGLGGFDESLPRFQDWDLAIRMLGNIRLGYISEPLVVVNDTPGSITRNFFAGLSARKSLMEKHKRLLKSQGMYETHLVDYLVRKVYFAMRRAIS